ncbi:hypothetical protein CH063_15952 [Colletotrichum higginsianum]|uniref:Uncharacterized protein n=1 Tax=Colletotrichum higginsianum (strain IMI 349063) TaxID=759273 RepID=H1W574_COLHI|nr:hypothetical protein CH063_15952 [Colletotrichum higginsianum]
MPARTSRPRRASTAPTSPASLPPVTAAAASPLLFGPPGEIDLYLEQCTSLPVTGGIVKRTAQEIFSQIQPAQA